MFSSSGSIEFELCELNTDFFIFTFYFVCFCFRGIVEQSVVKNLLEAQEEKPGVQAEAELPGKREVVRYRKDSQFLPSCSMKQSSLT